MTSPADQPPPEPDRGDPGKIRRARILGIAAVSCVFGAFAAAGLHHGWVPVACFAGVAAAFAVAAVAVLAGKGRRS